MVVPTTKLQLIGAGAAPESDIDATKPPALAPYIELPVYGVPPPDRKWQIDAIIAQLDQGQFNNAGRLGDSILRDSRIRGAYEQRMSGIFGAPLEMESSDEESAQANEIADDVKARWSKFFPRASLEELQRYGITQGIGIAEKVWDTSVKPWTFTIKVWHPQFYLWRWDTHAYYLITLDRGLIRIPKKSTQWIVYMPYGFERAFLLGNLRALLDPWLFRGWNKDDWGHYNEVHGHPIRKAIVPQQAVPKQEKEFVNSIANMGSNTVVKTRQDKDGNKYDVELLEAKGGGFQTFEQALEWSNGEIAETLLGQTMSMDGQAGLNSQEDPGSGVAGRIRRSDNEKLCECLKEQGVADYVEFAYGNRDLTPTPSYVVEPPADKAQEAQAELNRSNAASARILAGISTPEEEAIALAEGKNVSEVIDADQRRKILKASLAELETQAQNDLDDANDPESTPGEMERKGPEPDPGNFPGK